jgi:hypothetical protein
MTEIPDHLLARMDLPTVDDFAREVAHLTAELAVRTAERDSAIDVGGTRLEQLAAAQARIVELVSTVRASCPLTVDRGYEPVGPCHINADGSDCSMAGIAGGCAYRGPGGGGAPGLADTTERLVPVPEPGDWEFRVGDYTTEDLPDQDDESSHAIPDCQCGDWEEGLFDQRCAAQFEWRPAILHDEGGHGESFVRWLTDYEVAEWEKREAKP